MVDLASDAPLPAAPPRLARPLPWWKVLRATRASSIATWPDAAFDLRVMERRLLWRHIVVANSPEYAQHVLLDNAANYHRSRLTRQLLEPGLGTGLLTAQGEQWRRQRRLLAPAFAPRRIQAFAPGMITHAERLMAKWAAGPAERDIAVDMSAVTLAIISQAMFSAGDDPALDAVAQAVGTYQTAIRPSFADLFGLPDWWPRPARRQAKALFSRSDGIIRRLIETRRREGGPDDLLSAMLVAEDGESLTATEIRDQVATIFTAGHETTALTLTWALYLLAIHPAEAARLTDELDQVLGGRLPNASDVARLTFTRQVIDESMRLYPPAHTISRDAAGPDRLGPIDVATGTSVLILPWLLHRHRQLWEEPDRFRPDRFAPNAGSTRHRFAFIPFGGGPHICIGASFALMEAVLLLAAFCQRFQFTLVPDQRIEPVGLITLRPRDGLKMVVRPR